jgi:threonine aldolase
VIFAHEEAHIANDEAGAPGFFSGGAQIELLQAPDGKVTHAALAAALEAHPVSLHTTQPTALALSQATELGTSYRPDELSALCNLAHDHGLKVQMDGARFANAVAFLDCHPGDVTWRAGVDILSFGATKNGALAAEAVVFFDTTLVRDFELRRKQSGHLLSKSRYVSAQLLAYVESGVWLRNARRTNDFARKIGRAGAKLLMHPVEANEIFLALGQERKQALRQAGFEFYDWNAAGTGETRFVVSWDQREEDVLALCAALEKLS